MKNQELINAIATLANSIDSLSRAGQKEAITKVVAKMLVLIAKLK